MSEGSSGDEGSESSSGSVPESGVESDRDPESEPDIDPAVAVTAREELRTTFTYQVERLREIDTKAIEILKANLVLIGIVVTGGSIVVQTEFDLGGFLNPFTLAGGLLLLISTGLAAVTYTASDLRGGLSIADVDAMIAAERERGSPVDVEDRDAKDRDAKDRDAKDRDAKDRDAKDRDADDAGSTTPGFDERLLRSYAEWIDYNARVTAVNDLLATVTVLLVFLAFVYVVAGVAVGAAGLSAAESWVSFAVLTVLGGGFTWIAAHMDHLGPETRHAAASFDGVQLSKGADRTEAWSSLLAMLGREPSVESAVKSAAESPAAESSDPSEGAREEKDGKRSDG